MERLISSSLVRSRIVPFSNKFSLITWVPWLRLIRALSRMDSINLKLVYLHLSWLYSVHSCIEGILDFVPFVFLWNHNNESIITFRKIPSFVIMILDDKRFYRNDLFNRKSFIDLILAQILPNKRNERKIFCFNRWQIIYQLVQKCFLKLVIMSKINEKVSISPTKRF